MTLGENLQYLRTNKGLTQEALAEQLSVSRQSVSKWESDTAYPEMEKLIMLCDVFHVNMDVLLRGDAKTVVTEDTVGYDKHMNRYGFMIAFATLLIIFGVAIFMFLEGFGAAYENISIAVMLTVVAIAVAMFIVSGMVHERFEKKHPFIQDFYTEEEKESAFRKAIASIAGGVALIIIAVAWILHFMLTGKYTGVNR